MQSADPSPDNPKKTKTALQIFVHSLRYALTGGIWVAAQMSTTWWAFELWKISDARPPVQTMSVVIDEYAGIGIATGWLIGASFAELTLFCYIVMYSGLLASELRSAGSSLSVFSWYESVFISALVNFSVFFTVAGVSVSYAWTIATLPAIGPVMKTQSPYLASLGLQHMSFATSVAFAATCVSWLHGNQAQVQRMIHDAIYETAPEILDPVKAEQPSTTPSATTPLTLETKGGGLPAGGAVSFRIDGSYDQLRNRR